jgi:hypothetical protein
MKWTFYNMECSSVKIFTYIHGNQIFISDGLQQQYTYLRPTMLKYGEKNKN